MTLAVRRSIVEPDALALYMRAHYGLSETISCHLLSHGHDDLYRVEDGQYKYVFRLYASGNQRSDLEAQVEILNRMLEAELSVAHPIVGSHGYVLDVPTPEGLRHAILFTHVPGTPAGRGITSQQATAYGQLVARLHGVADAVNGLRAPLNISLSYLLDEPMVVIRSALSHRPDDVRFLQCAYKKLKHEITKLPQTRPAFGLCHGDLHKANILVDPHGSLTLVDWDCVGMGWRAYDLSILRWSIGPAVGKEGIGKLRLSAVWEAYLSGYLQRRPLSEGELAAIPFFVAARHIRVMGWELDRAVNGISGVGMLTEAYLDWWIEGFKSWIQQHCDL